MGMTFVEGVERMIKVSIAYADMPLGPTGAFRSAGACPPLEPSTKLGATRVLLRMSGRSVMGDWAPTDWEGTSPSSTKGAVSRRKTDSQDSTRFHEIVELAEQTDNATCGALWPVCDKSYWHEEVGMKGGLSSLQCLGKWHSILLHCLNQCLSYARRQFPYLLYRVCLNQKTRKGWASSQMSAFLQVWNLNRQKISCHAANTLAENSYELDLGYYTRRYPGPGGHSVAGGLVPLSVARVFYPPRQAEDKPRRYGHALDHLGAVDPVRLDSRGDGSCEPSLRCDCEARQCRSNLFLRERL